MNIECISIEDDVYITHLRHRMISSKRLLTILDVIIAQSL